MVDIEIEIKKLMTCYYGIHLVDENGVCSYCKNQILTESETKPMKTFHSHKLTGVKKT